MVKVSLRLATYYLFMYRVAQQCCPGGNRPETSPETRNNSFCAAGGVRAEIVRNPPEKHF